MKESFNYAVSGAGGFIGGHLYDRLKSDGFFVKRMGRYATREPGTDVFIDCASYGNLHGQNDVSEIYFANVERAVNLVLENKNENYKAFILISSSSVALPYQTYYSASKHAMEEFIKIYARETNKPVVAIRPYSITGMGEQPGHLIPTLIRAAYTGERVKFVPEPVHDFLDVDNFIDGIFTIIESLQKDNVLKGQVIPLGSGKQYTNQQVLEIVEKVTGKKVHIEIVDNLRKYDTKEWVADTTLMYSLGWKPIKTLEQSVREMVEDYERKNIGDK